MLCDVMYTLNLSVQLQIIQMMIVHSTVDWRAKKCKVLKVVEERANRDNLNQQSTNHIEHGILECISSWN